VLLLHAVLLLRCIGRRAGHRLTDHLIAHTGTTEIAVR
jgi:hypothetical protein